MAFSLGLTIDQTDNGQYISLIDSSNWNDYADTGVVSVVITATDSGNNTFTIVDEAYIATKPSNTLMWSIPVTSMNVAANTAIDDQQVTFVYTVTGSPNSGTLTKSVLFDYNSKYWKYQKFKDLPYSYWDGKPNWSKQVQEAALASVLVKGMQYSAEVGQTTKMNLILGTINDLRNQ